MATTGLTVQILLGLQVQADLAYSVDGCSILEFVFMYCWEGAHDKR
jgi:hypothetical protein